MRGGEEKDFLSPYPKGGGVGGSFLLLARRGKRGKTEKKEIK